MAISKHIINKQELKITLNSHKDAHVVQETILRAYKAHVIPVLDSLFDKYALHESNIKIDKLTIDIGSLTLNDLDTDFPEKVEKHIEEELIKYCNKPELNELIKYQSIYGKEQPVSADKSFKSKEELWIEALEIFLYTGSMPWWINRDSNTSIELIVAHLIEFYPAATKQLFEKQLKNSFARKRIIYQTSDTLLEKLILLMIPEFSKEKLNLVKNLIAIHSERAIIDLSETIFRKSVFNSVLVQVLKRGNNSSYTKSNEAQILYSIVHALACESGISKPSAKEIISILNFVQKNLNNSRNTKAIDSKAVLEYYVKQIIDQFQNTVLHNEKPIKKEVGDQSKKHDPETINNPKSKRKEFTGNEKDEADIGTNIDEERKADTKKNQNNEFDILNKGENIKNKLSTEQTKFGKPKNIVDNSEIEKTKLYQRSKELITEKEEDLSSFGNKYNKENQVTEIKKNKVQKENKSSIEDKAINEFSEEQTKFSKQKKVDNKSVNEKTKPYKRSNELISEKENDISSILGNTYNEENQKKEINKDKQIKNHHKSNALNKEDNKKRKIKDKNPQENNVQKDNITTIENNANKELSKEQTKVDIPKKADDRPENKEIKTFQKSNKLSPEKEKDISSSFGNKNSEENKIKEINLSSDQEFEKTLFAEPFILIPKIEEEYISNAGLIIVWPFLSSFFKEIGLVEKNNFVSDEAIFKAIHILQYLVTGKVKTQENELLLNKLLCGLDVYEPVPVEFKLSKKEKKECDILLLDIIENWKVLKSTSVESLQITFLQKEGLIKRQSGGWRLIIERTTVDILIDRLPWSISVIKLPWSKELLFVEW